MKKVALIHTVKSVNDTFAARIAKKMPEVQTYNLLDDFLAIDANVRGEFTKENLNRLFYLIKSAEMTDAQLIVTTCSTLTPWVVKIRPFIQKPILAIDDAMSEQAVKLGKKITVLATAQSTVLPTTEKLLADAQIAGKEIEISSVVCTEAFRALQKPDMELHDRLVMQEAQKISGSDVIVLAQASMAHLQQKIETLCGIKTLASPELCVERIHTILFPKG